MRLNWIGIRNGAIIVGLAVLGVVWQRTLTSLVVGVNQIITVLFVAGMIAVGYRYFREHELAWLVLKPWQRAVIFSCLGGVVFAALVGFQILGPLITPLGVMALIAALVLTILWVIRESRRFRG